MLQKLGQGQAEFITTILLNDFQVKKYGNLSVLIIGPQIDMTWLTEILLDPKWSHKTTASELFECI